MHLPSRRSLAEKSSAREKRCSFKSAGESIAPVENPLFRRKPEKHSDHRRRRGGFRREGYAETIVMISDEVPRRGSTKTIRGIPRRKRPRRVIAARGRQFRMERDVDSCLGACGKT